MPEPATSTDPRAPATSAGKGTELGYASSTPYRVDVSTGRPGQDGEALTIAVTIGSDARNILLGNIAFTLMLVGLALVAIGVIFMDAAGIPALLGGFVVLVAAGFLVMTARNVTGARRRRLVVTRGQVNAAEADWFPSHIPDEMRLGIHMVDVEQPIIPASQVHAVEVVESFEELEVDFPAGNVLRIDAESGTAVLFIPGNRDEAEQLAVVVREILGIPATGAEASFTGEGN